MDEISMKRDGYQHPKIHSLSGRLGICRAQAIGHLDLLWDFTAMAAIAGDVGKWDNCAIARACDWTGDPDLFIDALVGAGLLDRCGKHRLIVHDWEDHCESWVKIRASRVGVVFIAEASVERSVEASVERSAERSAEASAEASAVGRVGRGRVGQGKPVTEGEEERVSFPKNLDTLEFTEAWSAWKKHRREIKKPLTATQADKTLKMLGGIGLERATRAIEYTIAMGWQGLREPDASAPVAPLKPPSRVYDPATDGGEYDPYSPTGIRQV